MESEVLQPTSSPAGVKGGRNIPFAQTPQHKPLGSERDVPIWMPLLS